VVPDAALPEVVFGPDAGDGEVIAAARAARARWLVTGDRHLLDHREEVGCEVLAVAEALRLCGS
jgi:predicted nucleic acid-binding protein